ncbi:MAG: hypothetical protein JO289_15830 [Xanthobacteraceae bacterium]|nr:hypothetical protein [Xanthobacteraceae bacterium]
MTYLSNIVRSQGDPKLIQTGRSSLSSADKLARALGWFSIGLGLAELIAPNSITRALGLRGKEGLVRSYGAREIAAGVLSLSTEKQAGLWSRVAGDGLDAATLASGLRNDNPQRNNVAFALMMVLGIAALDIAVAQQTTARHTRSRSRPRLYADRSGFPKGLGAARAAARDYRPPSNTQRPPTLAQASPI